MMVDCVTCGKPFKVKPSDYKRGVKRCSRECRKKPPKPCQVCGELMYVYQTKNKYCSVECRGIARKGPNHPLWNGGRYESEGYIYIYDGEKHIREHRYLMEKKIGRPLKPYEEVHHIDFDGKNNDMKNLVLLTKAQHTALHNKLDAYDLEHITKEELYNLTIKLLSEEGIEI